TLFIIYYFYGENRTKLPPGPSFHLPIVGHLPFLGDNPAKTFLKWSKIYGPILHVRLGSFHAVVINDGQLIRKAFNLNSFSGRPQIKVIDESTRNRKGFMFSDGDVFDKNDKDFQQLAKNLSEGGSMDTRKLRILSRPFLPLMETLQSLCKIYSWRG
ncbi:unnamed protein product, partial [Allacma fusca]